MRICQSTDSRPEVHDRRSGTRRLRAWARTLAVPVTAALLGACGGDATRVCFGSDEFCRRAFGAPLDPQARAGDHQDVSAGATVVLDGSASSDGDGHITSYSWTQLQGPPVALEGSSTAQASFTAPEVDDPTVLVFRLLVTDDDARSDEDSVRVTVTPGTAAALRAGIAALKAVHRPDRIAVSGAAAHRFAGLWLGARVRAFEAGGDADLNELLDELRVVTHGLTARPPAARAAGGPVAGSLQLGLREVARFTARRDPAVAALAAGAAGGAGADPTGRKWLAVLDADRSPAESAARRSAARRLLLAAPARAAPDAVAAAVLLLALPVAAPVATDGPLEAQFVLHGLGFGLER